MDQICNIGGCVLIFVLIALLLLKPNGVMSLFEGQNANSVANSNNNKTIVHIKEKVQEMINIQWILFTLLLLICTEWFIRKYNGLY